MIIKNPLFLAEIKKNRTAVGAFNVSSLEALQAVFAAAEQTKRPVIIETSVGEAQYFTPTLLYAMCTDLARTHQVDFVLHLDRGSNLELICLCLESGYTSISCEFSDLSFTEVVKKTKEIRKMTKQYGAQLEGAMNVVPLRYYSDRYQKELIPTDPDLAVQFVSETAVDSLVVSIGNQSGKLKSEVPLDLDLLKKINTLLPNMPLVLHGGSFLNDITVATCITYGVTKINVNTEVRLAYSNTLKNNLIKNPDEYAPYRLLAGTREAMEKIIVDKIKLFSHR